MPPPSGSATFTHLGKVRNQLSDPASEHRRIAIGFLWVSLFVFVGKLAGAAKTSSDAHSRRPTPPWWPDQWRALGNVAELPAVGGRLFIALYNDQGWGSRAWTWTWTWTKSAYCAASRPLKAVILALSMIRLWGPTTLRDLLKGRPGATWRAYGEADARGMTPWRDVIDWVGGYPFEVSRPEEVFEFLHGRGYQLDKLKTCGGGHGCNEFVFVKTGG